MRHHSTLPVATLLVVVTLAASAKGHPTVFMGTFVIPERGKVGVNIYIDSVTRQQTWLTAQQERQFTDPQPTTTSGSYRSELDTDAYDCDGQRIAAISHVKYAGEKLSGDIVEKVEHSSPSAYEWSTPTAGSPMDQVLKMVCRLAAAKNDTMRHPKLR